MKAIVYQRYGAASDVLELLEMPTPTPAAGEVLVRLHASGVNPSDVKARAGARPGVTALPFPQIIPHSDGAGVIEAVGEGVSPSRVGARVWLWNGQWRRAFGTAAEYIAVPESQAVPLAESVSFEVGATLGIPGVTATYAVLSGGDVAGKTVVISGGAGTVGRLAVMVAKASGARVLATASAGAGMQTAYDAGADKVFEYKSPDLADQILAETGGQLVDRIVEVEFGKNVETHARIIAENGTIASYGSALDMTPEIPFYPLMFKAVTIELILVYLLPDAVRQMVNAQLTALLDRGALQVIVDRTLGLSDCAKAHEIVEQGQRQGSVILTM